MKPVQKNLYLIVICFLMSLISEGQTKKKEFSISTGFALNHSELGTPWQSFSPGGHLGFNFYTKEVKRFKTDLQVSLTLSGRSGSGSLLSFNALYGGRFYITDPEKPTKVYANLLLGGSLINELGDDFVEIFGSIGYSSGLFLVKNRLVIGAAAESYNNFIFKVGYRL